MALTPHCLRKKDKQYIIIFSKLFESDNLKPSIQSPEHEAKKLGTLRLKRDSNVDCCVGFTFLLPFTNHLSLDIHSSYNDRRRCSSCVVVGSWGPIFDVGHI